jgi:hypothetical protein
VVRISGYRSRSRVRFPELPDFLSSSGSGTGSAQPREPHDRKASPTGGGRSVGIVRSRTKATEFSLVLYNLILMSATENQM